MRTKAKDKEKQCAYCDRTFTKEEHLKRHERSHTGEKPFKCHKCDRRYGRSDVLARHLQKHPSEVVVRVSHLTSPANAVGSNDNDQRALKSAASRSDLSDPFQPSFRPSTLPDHEQFFATPTGALPPPNYQPSFLRSSLSNIDECMNGAPLPSIGQNSNVSGQSQALTSVHPTNSTPWGTAGHEDSNGSGKEDWHGLTTMPRVRPETASIFNMAELDSNANPVIDASPSAHTIRSQTPLCPDWHAAGDQETARPEDGVQERLLVRGLEQTYSQGSTAQPENLSTLLQPERADRLEPDQFLFNMDFASHTYLSPGILDYLDFATPPSPISNSPRPNNDQSSKPAILFSVDQLQRMRPLWRGQRSAPGIRIVRCLWHMVVQHQADNIFTQLPGITAHDLLSAGCSRTSRWGIGDDCRKGIIDFCKELDDKILPQDLMDLTPQPTPLAADSESGPDHSLPNSLADGFPTTEVLDASLDLFFQCPPLPFLHKATFDATNTPKELLLPMCLIGLSSLYPGRSKTFVLRHQKRLMHFCRSDLTSKALGHCQPSELLVAIASTLLVVYLGLAYLEDLDECQAHMLAVQMLHIAEKHGLFTAGDGDDLVMELQAGPTDSQGSWKAWSRVESVKRMISCLLWMDMAYTRLMGSAGVADMDKVELHLPCESALFDAPTASRFLVAAQCGAQLMAPRMHVHQFHVDPPAFLDHMSMETVLVALYLQIAAIRHKLPLASSKFLEAREILSKSSKAKDVVKSILLLPSKYAGLFRQRHRVTALAWNNVCIALTADLNLLEIAFGREGLEPAQTAMSVVAKWAQTPSARRATLHAAQIFDILSSSRLSESNIARPDLLLFNSALVLSMYLAASSQDGNDHEPRTLELLQDVDWSSVAAEGMRGSSQTIPSSPHNTLERSDDPTEAVRDFIRYGGPVSFAGEVQQGGSSTVRKILLHYVRLLEDLGKWHESRYSRLLRAMSDFVIEGNR